MKKKLLVLITALVMVCACVLGLVACGGDFEEGTYVMYSLIEEGGNKYAMAGPEYELKDGKMTGDFGDGTYKVDGDKIVVTMKTGSGENAKEESYTFTKKDNMWVGEIEKGQQVAVCKKGETPKGYTVKTYEEIFGN